MKITKLFIAGACTFLVSSSVMAATFVNGGFETGNADGWITGQGYRGNDFNSTLTPSSVLPGGSLYDGPSTHSSVINSSYVDPNIGAALGSTVYTGNYSYRIEDTTSGGYASAISQKVQGYTDDKITFAWKAVLENGGHVADESAVFRIVLRDDTTGQNVINRTYDAGATGGGVDTRFAVDGNFFYTAAWQVEELLIDAALAGHDFTLSLLAADCEPTGHTGYAYLDGFGAVLPPPGGAGDPPPAGQVPLPGTLALLSLGFAGFGAARKRRQA